MRNTIFKEYQKREGSIPIRRGSNEYRSFSLKLLRRVGKRQEQQ